MSEPRPERDDGGALVVVLLLITLCALLVLSLLTYSTTAATSGKAVNERLKRTEAVKGGLRVALANPTGLYTVCGDASATAAVDLATPGTAIAITTSCYRMSSSEQYEPSQLPYSVITTEVGSVPPVGPFITGTVYPGSGGSPASAWTLDTSSTRSGGTIWLPHLPNRLLEIRSPSGYKMSNGYPQSGAGSCTVFFPGTYTSPVTLSGDGSYYFTSGVYYFENFISIKDSAKVVVGAGTTQGCVSSDQEAAFYADNAPYSHGITGSGATFVLGKFGYFDISDATATGGTGLSVIFNKRYVSSDEPAVASSASVSIMSVNGELGADGAGVDLVRETLVVPRSKVIGTDGLADRDATLAGFVPSRMTSLSTSSLLNISLTNTRVATVDIPGYISIPQGDVSIRTSTATAANKWITLRGGVLAGKIDIGTDARAGTFELGLSNPVVMHTLKIVSSTSTGWPRVTSTAIVQVTEDGNTGINHWHVDGPASNGMATGVTTAPDPSTPGRCPTTIGGWQGEYFGDRNLSGPRLLCRDDADVNFNWMLEAPAAGLPSDDFSVRWTKTITTTAGLWDFTVTSDDGFRLFIDGVKVGECWCNRSARASRVSKDMTAGPHVIVVEYYDKVRNASARVVMAPNGT
ncbi:MAG: PA14 domain-containing protein [Ilumatobacteraceae bacterium]